MDYRTGGAFRRALEDRLRARSLHTGSPLVRLRKMVVFDRFLARLIQDQPDVWVLKGGLALQLRLGSRARTTKDIDVLLTIPYDGLDLVHQRLVRASRTDPGDWFRFEVERPEGDIPEHPIGGVRFRVRGLLDGRRFETFHIDVGWGDPLVEPAETLTTPALLDFAGIQPTAIPCYPLAQQLAEKAHAYTRPHGTREGSRVKDLVDILLIAELGRIDAQLLHQALNATFDKRRSHEMPACLPHPPSAWSAPYRRLAVQTGLNHQALADANEAASRFLDPVLGSETAGIWDPATWAWLPRRSTTGTSVGSG